MRVLLPMVLFAAAAVAADEQHSCPFDNYRAIFAVCVSSLNVEWTSEARKYLLNEVNRRAAGEKLFVSVDNNMSPDKFREAHGLTKEQVIWLVMKFEDSSSYKGGVNFTFNAPNFYLQGAVFDPGVPFAKAKPSLIACSMDSSTTAKANSSPVSISRTEQDAYAPSQTDR